MNNLDLSKKISQKNKYKKQLKKAINVIGRQLKRSKF